MPSIIALGVWRNIGNSMVIFLAALQTVDPQLYEAARVDGAKGRHLFRHITVPMLRPAILFTTVITTIGYLQVFEEPFVMTGPNGGARPGRASPPRCSSTSRASGSSTSATRAPRRTRCSSFIVGAGDHPVPLPEDEVMTALRIPLARARARSASEPRGHAAARRGGCSSLLVARHAADDRAVRVDAARRVQDQRRLPPHDADAAARDTGRWTTSAGCSPSRTSSATSSTRPGSRSWSRRPTCCSARWPATRWPSCASPATGR